MRPFERITISGSEILDYPATHRILGNLKRLGLLPTEYTKPEIVDSGIEAQKISLEALKRRAPENHPVGLGKRILHLTTQQGTSVKNCPGTNNMLCCHYNIINMVSNCPFDCTYCYLQTYLNQPMTTFFVNEEDILKQIRGLCEAHASTGTAEKRAAWPLRVGTGELADSLALDPITEFSERIAAVMGEYEDVRLELKTKSKSVEHLFRMPRKDHVIVSWSMNPPEIINAEEHGTARFEERVHAAAACAAQGFRLGFHFDPMIYVENWQEIYDRALMYLLANVPHDRIGTISMGALRYQPQLKTIALKRRPDTDLFAEESVAGSDGKVRYLRATRTEMFAFLNSRIKELAPSVYTYLCMESVPVWEKALGRMPDRGF